MSEQRRQSTDPFQVGDLIRYRGSKKGRNRGRPREVIRVLPDRIETMALDGNGRNSTIDRRRLSLYELVRAASWTPGPERGDVSGPAIVTTTDQEGNVLGREECQLNDYVIVCGPDCWIEHVQRWANGTVQLTIKRERGAGT